MPGCDHMSQLALSLRGHARIAGGATARALAQARRTLRYAARMERKKEKRF